MRKRNNIGKRKKQKERKMLPMRERLLCFLSTLLQLFLSPAQKCWVPTHHP